MFDVHAAHTVNLQQDDTAVLNVPTLFRYHAPDMKRAFLHAACLGLLVLTAGCLTTMSDRPAARPAAGFRRQYVIKPVVAVTDFENLANFSGKWHLGEGMAEMLTTELLASRKVTVLERRKLDDLLGEIVLQGKELFRKEGRVEKGRLMNARFVITGAVTDFTATGDASGWFGTPQGKAGARGSRSRVALHVRVTDVETGEILSSVKTEGSSSIGWFGAAVNYRDFSFGGDAFFRTPLGRATEAAIAKALRQVLRDLPAQYWQPRVADAGPNDIIINGGENVRLREGLVFVVRGEGRTVTDPVTGNVVERLPGREVGQVRVTEVKPTSAHALITQGEAHRGDILEPVEP